MADDDEAGRGVPPMSAAGERCGGTVYRSARDGRLGPRDIRAARFSPTRLGRRGLDPDEVHRFLNRIAAEMAALHAELAGTRDENHRVKTALREWQSRHDRSGRRRRA